MGEMPLLSKSLLAATFSFEHDLSENRYPPRIKCGAGFFRIMLSTRKGRRKPVATPESVSLVDALY